MASLFLPAPTRSKRAPVPASHTASGSGAGAAAAAAVGSALVSISASKSSAVTTATTTAAPSYETRCQAALEFSRLSPVERKSRKGKGLFVPRKITDFDDGGAFPEIHVAQYPKNMGNPHLLRANKQNASNNNNKNNKNNNNNRSSNGAIANAGAGSSSSTTRAIVNVQIDASGKKDYTSLIRGGTNSDKQVYARHSDLKGYNPTAEEVSLPTQQEANETASKTQAAIDALLSSKVAMSKPSGTALANAATSKNQEEKTQFIEYTSNPNAPGYNPAASKRVIQMVPAQLDPMMPPKHKHIKAPPGPADDFIPVLHAPPEKLTKEEREAWNVPACISNWKNTRGYTIPLDKRLAADGRGLRDDTTINSNFATLSESLYLAERQAREEVRLRSLVQKRQAEGDRERRERELRELAMKARMGRSGVAPQNQPPPMQSSSSTANTNVNATATATTNNYQETDHGGRAGGDEESVIPSDKQRQSQEHSYYGPSGGNNNNDANIIDDEEGGDDNEKAEEMKRERIRMARRKEHERDLRMEKHRPNKRDGEEEEEDVAIKKARLGDRDVSEKIALGVHTGGGGLGGGVDGRLYNQNAGLDSGFGAEDDYTTYSKPMFNRDGVTSSSIYRPTRGEGAMDADEQYAKLKSGATAKFQPDKGFSGADGGAAVAGGARNAPVQFEKGDSK